MGSITGYYRIPWNTGGSVTGYHRIWGVSRDTKGYHRIPGGGHGSYHRIPGDTTAYRGSYHRIPGQCHGIRREGSYHGIPRDTDTWVPGWCHGMPGGWGDTTRWDAQASLEPAIRAELASGINPIDKAQGIRGMPGGYQIAAHTGRTAPLLDRAPAARP